MSAYGKYGRSYYQTEESFYSVASNYIECKITKMINLYPNSYANSSWVWCAVCWDHWSWVCGCRRLPEPSE